MDFHTAWWWLYNHPIFNDGGTVIKKSQVLPELVRPEDPEETTVYDSYFHRCLDIDVQKVNPDTEEVDDDRSKNTKTEVWLECGPWHSRKKDPAWFDDYPDMPDCASHDIDLDCGGDTFEEAILELAKLVRNKYGDYDKEVYA